MSTDQRDGPDDGSAPARRSDVEEEMSRADRVNGEDSPSSDGHPTRHPTGEAAAQRNREEDPPA